MQQVNVNHVGPEAAGTVLDLVARLLQELGEEGDESGPLDETALISAWRADEPHQFVFLAVAEDGSSVGVATVTETFALYANGPYGIINEMYVSPEYRSEGVGAQMIAAVKALGEAKGWRRIDVTAPESQSWGRTRRFYEREGFVFTGPKLKFLVPENAGIHRKP